MDTSHSERKNQNDLLEEDCRNSFFALCPKFFDELKRRRHCLRRFSIL